MLIKITIGETPKKKIQRQQSKEMNLSRTKKEQERKERRERGRKSRNKRDIQQYKCHITDKHEATTKRKRL